MTSARPQSTRPPPSSFRIRGGDDAPERARRHLLGQIEGGVSDREASEATLIVSELVTNSVVHAHVDERKALFLELTMLGDHLRIAVIDPGAELEPEIRSLDPTRPGGFGLRLVDQISSAWGVTRQTEGETRVWCELPLDPAESHSRLAAGWGAASMPARTGEHPPAQVRPALA